MSTISLHLEPSNSWINPLVDGIDPNLRLCELKVADIDQILSLGEQCANSCEYTTLEREEDLESIFALESTVFGLMHDETLVGYGTVIYHDSLLVTRLFKRYVVEHHEPVEKSARLLNCVIHSSFRGKGYQKALITAREFYSSIRGRNTLYTSVHNENHASLENLKSSGYERIGTRVSDGLWNLYAKHL